VASSAAARSPVEWPPRRPSPANTEDRTSPQHRDISAHHLRRVGRGQASGPHAVHEEGHATVPSSSEPGARVAIPGPPSIVIIRTTSTTVQPKIPLCIALLQSG
jgi:hypothetical protein